MAADILDFPPPVTGRVETAEEYWHRQAQNLRREVSDEYGRRIKAELAVSRLQSVVDGYNRRITDGKLIGPAAFWVRMALCAGSFLVLGYLLGRVTL